MKLVPSALLTLLGVVSSACADSQSPPTSTIAVVNDTCPESESGVRGWEKKESAILTALATKLLPSVVGGAWDAVANAVHKKATDKERSVAARTGFSFYGANAAGDLSPGSQTGCLFFSTGPMAIAPNQNDDPPPISSGALTKLKDKGQRQLKAAGITARPNIYFEASFEFSPDHTAFRLVPERLFYALTIDAKERSNTNGLAVVATFRRPSATNAGEAFAVGAMAFPFARPSHEYFAPALGAPSGRLASNWMPLPSPDQQVTKTLAALAENTATADTNAERIAILLAQPASDGNLFAKRLSNPNEFRCDYADKQKWADSKAPVQFDTWRFALNKSIETAIREKTRADAAEQKAPAPRKPSLADIAADRAIEVEILKACATAADARRKIQEGLKTVKANTAVDVEISVTESFEPSKFLVWADTVLTGSKEGATKAIVDQLDPTKRETDAAAAKTARQSSEDAARQALVEAQKAEIDLAEKPAGSAEQRKGMLDLDLTKRMVNRQYAELGWAAPFPEVQH